MFIKQILSFDWKMTTKLKRGMQLIKIQIFEHKIKPLKYSELSDFYDLLNLNVCHF